MKTLHVIAAALGLSTFSMAPMAAQPTAQGLVAGLNQAVAAAPSPNAGAAAVPDVAPIVTTGTVNVSARITVVSTAVTTDTPILCSVQITMTENTVTAPFIETGNAMATRNGSIASCTVSIPYQWVVSNGSGAAMQITAQFQTATPDQPVIRSGSRQLAQTPVPANGTTLTLGYDARI